MNVSICGAECSQCPHRSACGGCTETSGRPFGRECILAACCRGKGGDSCGQCGGVCILKVPLLAEFNHLGIPDLPEITDLNALPGSFINLSYTLPNGQTVQLLEDDKIYLGNQLEQAGRESADEERRRQLEGRARPLRSMYRDVRAVARHLEHYYEKHAPRQAGAVTSPRRKRRT